MRFTQVWKTTSIFLFIMVLYMVFVYRKYGRSHDSVNVNILKPHDWDDIDCVQTKTLPPFTACLLPLELSKVSVNISKNRMWEKYLVTMLQRSFAVYPQSTFIDVGANLGFFTMLAATMGHRVVSVEPIAETLRRLQKSVAQDKLNDKVMILNNAISDRRSHLTMGGDDPRADYVQVLKEVSMAKSQGKGKVSHSIYMDDLLRFVTTDVAILKIDIEGYECQAMKKMSELIQNVYVPYIFMEWLWIYRNQHKSGTWCTATELRNLVSRLMDAGYVPFDAKRRTTGRLDPQTVSTTWDVKDMGWRHKTAPHLVF